MVYPNIMAIMIRKYGINNIIKSIPTLMDNLLVYSFLKKPKRGPLFVSWDITSKCNFKCSYCNRWKSKKQELDTLNKLKIVNQLGKAGVKMLSLCDGEPLLSDDLILIIKEAKKYNININISTNGYLLEKLADKLIKSDLDSIIISVESHKDYVHDSIRKKGSFKSILAGIKKINKLRQNKKPFVSIRTLVNRKTFFQLHNFVSYWQTKVDEIMFQPIHSNPCLCFKIPKEMEFKQKEDLMCLKYFSVLLKNFKCLNNQYNKKIPSYLFDKNSLKKDIICFCGFLYIDIDAEGSVYPCIQHHINVGNLQKRTFDKIWNSDKLNKYRNSIKSKKNNCICWYNCSMIDIYMSKIFLKFKSNAQNDT
ncbi:MAG: radical SAM protein [Nanoarchaeota archaeon]